MKPLATITGENGETITLSFDATMGRLFAESFGEPTYQVGPEFKSLEAAGEYIQDSWNNGWNLRWI